MGDQNAKLDYEVPTERKATNRVFWIMVVIVTLLLLGVLSFFVVVG